MRSEFWLILPKLSSLPWTLFGARISATCSTMRQTLMRRTVVLASIFLTALFGLVGCTSGGGSCSSGHHCECSGGDECYLGCADGHCDQACSSMNRCGTVCGDGCTSQCSSIGSECSQFCGAGCVLSCFSMPTCGVICGAGCHYDCHDVNQCAAQVGPDSDVTCNHFQTCAVECSGHCVVHTDNPCQVTCAGGVPAALCATGLYACGGC